MSATGSQNASKWRAAAKTASLAVLAAALGACATSTEPAAPSETAPASAPVNPAAQVHPELWPEAQSGVSRDEAIEARVAALLAQMSIEEKVGQIIQADVNSVTPEDVRRYRLGSVLNGGNSGPGGDDRAAAPVWLEFADRFYDASMDVPEGRPAIPVIWGSDSVHGNANIIGATVFPHNIGLGAMRNPELMQKIGEVTALETRITGQDWTFAPTIAVVRDDRWGRTYEAYSEEPRIVEEYAGAIVRGIQGDPGDADFLRGPHVIATAKHFLGDGGTSGGRDQGDNQFSEADLRDLFSPGYRTAVEAGVQSVMASYNSWHGEKMHGHRGLLTDVLVGRYGLDGFVVGDWNGHGQVAGCTPTSCAASVNAGLDMFMAPDTWRGLYDSTLAQAQSGEIPMARLDEAVARILRVKFRAGLFEAGRPSSRPYAGQFDLLGAPEHRAIARQAVRESLVLLKNDNAILPLRRNARVLVAGDGADNLGKQTGGWTISWQGTGNSRADFPNGQTIFEAIRDTVRAHRGTATLSVDGSFDRRRRPDVAIVVFGEDPYAEFQGDRANVDYAPTADLELIQRLRAQNIPVVSVFLSGRPLYVTPEINASNAFVAAWLPGTEGGGVADLLFRTGHDFSGKLSFSWPRAPDQTPLNVGDANYNPLFAFGYGLSYAAPRNLGELPLAATAEASASSVDNYFDQGRPVAPWMIQVNNGGLTTIDAAIAESSAGPTVLSAIDRAQQEDALLATWSGAGAGRLAFGGPPVDLSRQANGDMSIAFDVRVDQAPDGPAVLRLGADARLGALDIGPLLRARAGQGWGTLKVRLSCFGAAGADLAAVSRPFELASGSAMRLGVADVRLAATEAASATCPGAAQ